MARKKQQLINYHTSGVTNMPQVEDVALGEIVVRHATDKPELLIKKDNNEFATFIDSTSISGKLDTLKTYIEGQIDSLESASTRDLKAFSATVVNTYATSADTESAIATAKSEAVSSGKGYTDGQISAVTSAYTKADTELENKITSLSGSVSAFSATVVNDYATKVIASGYAMTAEANAVASGASYTDAKVKAVEGKIESLSGSVSAFSATVVNDYATKVIASGYAMTAEANAVASGKGYTDGQISAVITAYTQADTELKNKITSLSGSVSALSEELRSEIADKVSSAYIYKGSVSDVSKLPPTGNVKGDVYNVINANGAPGDDNYTPAGTNYAWDGEKWDALGGVVDLSNYATTATTHDISTGLTALQSTVNEFSGAVDTKFTEYTVTTAMTQLIANAKSEAISSGASYTNAKVKAVEGKIESLSGSVSAFSATVVSDYATKVMASGYAMTAEANAVASGKGYTDTQINAVITAYTQADTELDARIDKLEAISADTQSAVQNVVVTNTDVNKITATKTDKNNVVTLNFDNMVIDCGDF